MSKKVATPFETRTQQFAETGAKLAGKYGVVHVTRRAIAQAHNCTDPLVGKHLGKREEMRATIKKTMKRLGISEPTGAPKAPKATKVVKDAVVTKGTKKAAAKKAAVEKATKAPKVTKAVKVTKKAAAKKAPANKAIKKAPANKAVPMTPKMPPLPTLVPETSA